MKIDFNPFINRYGLDNKNIKAQLNALGLESTGNQQRDLQLIRETLEKQQVNSAQIPSEMRPQPGDKPLPPWADFMEKLGLKLTGSKESDFAAIASKLNQLEIQAITDNEKQNVNELRSEFARIKESTNEIGIAPPPNDLFAGQNQLASLNKFFLLSSQ